MLVVGSISQNLAIFIFNQMCHFVFGCWCLVNTWTSALRSSLADSSLVLATLPEKVVATLAVAAGGAAVAAMAGDSLALDVGRFLKDRRIISTTEQCFRVPRFPSYLIL